MASQSQQQPWEEAQTEPLLPGRKSLDDDPDRTLPLSDANDAEMAGAGRGGANGEGGESVEQLLQRLSAPSSPNGEAMGEGEASAILSHLSRLKNISGSEGGEEGVRWTADNVRLVRAAVKSAMRSLASDNAAASTNADAGSSSGGGYKSGEQGVALMEPAIARRILSDGILPLNSAGCAAGEKNAGERNGTPPCVWVAKLVRSIVVEDLLPAALAADEGTESSEGSGTSSEGNASADGNNNATLDVLLAPFLSRMDGDESSRILPSEHNGAYSVDDILDRLCGVPSSTSGGGDNGTRPKLRPSAAAAVLGALRELETNAHGGRLSRRRVWKARRGGGSSQQRKECEYVHADRPTHLINAALQSLQTLAENVRKGTGDPDAVPPLVHQLALAPVGLAAASSATTVASGGGKGEKRETAKQRGQRLRRVCLEGVASVLEEDDGAAGRGENGSNGGIALHDSPKRKQRADDTAWRWARHTCLSHLGQAIQTDPEMGTAVLGLLSGGVAGASAATDASGEAAPCRYARLTPFRLSMGLAMASNVPRMRAAALDAVRDLVVEEETIRIRRGLGLDGTVLGMGKPWMDCLVKCLESESNEDGARHHVLRCLLRVAQFSEGASEGGGSAAALLQSLVQLGFLLVDCVKKDSPASRPTVTLGGDAIRPVAVLAPTLDVSTSSASTPADISPTHAAASVGRCLLSYCFYRSAAAASPFLSSSISLGGNRGGSDGGTALCRSILRTAMGKFCSMAPNAAEHALLLTDLLGFSPLALKGLLNEDGGTDGDVEGLDDAQKRQAIPLALAAHHLPNLIDTLSNVPSGGMSPHVASLAVAPAVGRVLLIQATQQRLGLGTLWKRSDLSDHVDHAFLLAKKALFSADVEKRRYAANMLVTLLGVAAVASSTGSRAGGSSVWSSILYDMRGCLRRCLTQHQLAVRAEAYSSLVALLPTSVSGAAGNTQDSSPASTVSSVATPPPLAPLRATASPALSIPSAGQNALVCIVSELLLSSVERYVTIKEDLTDREARRKRAAQGVGLSQMEMVVEEESPPEMRKGGGDEEMSNPFRFEKMISTRPSNPLADGKGGGKKKAKAPIGQMLLTEALNRIEEPLPLLLASCIAVTPLLANVEDGNDDEMPSGNEMKKALYRIRRQMACCTDVDEYVKWIKNNKAIFDIKDNSMRAQEMAKAKIATLVLVAMIADVLISTCTSSEETVVVFDLTGGRSDEKTSDIEDLFSLREDAIDEAALIMSSFVSAKPSKKKGGKKGMKERNANLDEDDEPKKKKGKSAAAAGGTIITKVKESEVNDATRAKNRALIERALHNMSSVTSHEFLADSLRRFGAEASKKVDAADSDNDSDDDEDEGDASTRLARSLAFRRYIITKCLLLMSGSSPLVKAGARFGPLVGPDVELDEKSASTARIAASMTLGPLLFTEFASHSYHLGRTSLASKPSSSSSSAQSNSELSLAQLSMRAFVSCVRGMTCDAPRHAMTTATRVNALLMSSIARASNVVEASKDGFNYYKEKVDAGSPCVGVPEDEATLGRTLYPFLSLAATTSSEEAGNDDGSTTTTTRLCLLSELLENAMHGEAAELSHLISTAAEAFVEPNMKEQLGVILLRAWELGDGDRVGVLGLDHGEEGGGSTDSSSCISLAVKIALKLNCGLDGNTHVPIPEGGSSSPGGSSLRHARAKMGLPTTLVENWPEKHLKRLQKESHSSSGVVGIGPQIAWAISAALGIGNHFVKTFDNDSPCKSALKLKVIKAAAPHASEKSSIAGSLASSIDEALNNAEFVTQKMIPHIPNGGLVDLAQRFVSCLLFSVSKMLGAAAPSAEFIDVNGSHASTLLKSTKRFYGVLAKLILSFMDCPESLMSTETKRLLDHLTATLMPRVSALLMTLQEKQETASGKFLAESKIESHGKTSALLVFEKEKLDNALLKVGNKLKQAGLEDESEWLEKHVVSNQNRDFVIRGVADAKAREAPKKKVKKEAGAKKRKVKSEPGADKKKRKKKKKKQRAESEDDDESDGNETQESVMESVDADESMDEDGSDVVDLDKLTADMEDDEEEDDDDDDDDESDEEGSGSEGEAELDD